MAERHLIGRFIVDQYVTIGQGMVVTDCYFDGCIIDMPATTTVATVRECEFAHCEFRGEGWPRGVLEILRKAGRRNW